MSSTVSRSVSASHSRWVFAQPLRISRETLYDLDVITAEVREGGIVGRGECVPVRHFGYTVESVLEEIENVQPKIEAGADRQTLLELMPPGPARNAVDCALWDLEAKLTGRTIWDLAGVPPAETLQTVLTISLDNPENMAKAASTAVASKYLKLKLGSKVDSECVLAVRKAVPGARIIVDINEGWSMSQLKDMASVMAEAGVELIEQPLPTSEDDAVAKFCSPVPLCADESCVHIGDLDRMCDSYQFINIKLDKCGGLTAALRMAQEARKRGLGLMVGCMCGTSLSMAPAFVLGSLCDHVDIDGPLLLANDRNRAMAYHGNRVLAPPAGLWG